MDYEFTTTFWQDFSIADSFGMEAIQDTFDRAFKEWRTDIKYMTELTIALNYKIWLWAERDEEVARLYDRLWREADRYCMDNFSGEELKYFIKTTD